MYTIALADILVPNDRQRSEIPDDHIGELMGSIFDDKGPGLINAITLVDGKTLKAGECRMRAVTLGYKMGRKLRHGGQLVPAGEIPFVNFGDLSELAQMQLEYDENSKRRNLTWQDDVRATELLANIKKKLEPHIPNSRLVVEIAEERLGVVNQQRKTDVQASLDIAKHMHDPDIGKAKSLNEAKKILARKVDAGHRQVLAAATGKIAASARMTCHHANCLDWMKEQPDEQFDVILTDPPYGMGADTFGDGAGRLVEIGHEYKDDYDGTQQLLAACIPEFYRLAKPESHLYLWCDIDLFLWLREQCRAAGWWTFRTPLINVKPEGGRVPWPENGPRRCYEICLYAVKGKRPVSSIQPDVFESRLVEGNFGHGAQKPVEAYVNLLKRSIRPGNIVFDPFAGTGTIFPAAAAVDCFAVGVEQEAAAFGTCIRRIGELE